jgi:hypothetical protein
VKLVNRILWNRRPDDRSGGDIDEIVLHDVTVHVEQMSDRCWWIGIYRPGDNEYWMGNFTCKKGRMRFSQQENAGIDWDRDDTHEAIA